VNYIATKLNFLKVMRADTFQVTFTIDDAYEITGDTRIQMQVKPSGDIPEPAILSFDSDDDDITISGQQITFHKELTDMNVRPGKYLHEIHFTKENITSTLYAGIFEIL